jgi:hypothetical protein
MVIDSGLDTESSSLSVTFTVKVKIPPVVGVPLIAPFVDSPNPGGNDPAANDQEYGDLPPAAASVTAYAAFTLPFGNETVVIESGKVMTSVKFLSSVFDAESLNVTLIGKLPTKLGVPVIWPVDALIASGEGSPVALQVYGGRPPVPVIVNEYGIPTDPESSDDV